VVPQEERPLAVLGDRRRVLEGINDRDAVLHADRHEQTRHERKVERHVAFVPLAEVGHGVLGPLVGLSEQHAVAVVLIDVLAELFQKLMRLGQVLTVGSFPLEKVGDGVKPHAVDTHLEPGVENLEHLFTHQRVIVVEVRLVRIEAVPVVRPGHGIPRPVRGLEVLEDDAGVAVTVGPVAPDVEVTPGRAGRGAAAALEPGMLIRGMVQDQFDDDPQVMLVRLAEEMPELTQRSVGRMNVGVVGDVVAVIPPGRGVEREQPERGNTQVLKVIELLGQSREIAHPVAVAVAEGTDMQLVDDGIFEPEGVLSEDKGIARLRHAVLALR
jgi:hypothetical protein